LEDGANNSGDAKRLFELCIYISRVATAREHLGCSRCISDPPHLERLEKLEILIRNTNRDSRSGVAPLKARIKLWRRRFPIMAFSATRLFERAS